MALVQFRGNSIKTGLVGPGLHVAGEKILAAQKVARGRFRQDTCRAHSSWRSSAQKVYAPGVSKPTFLPTEGCWMVTDLPGHVKRANKRIIVI